MGKLLDALMMRKTPVNNADMFYGPNTATEGQPVPVAYAHEPMSDLSGPSSISRAAVGAWPEPLDALSMRLVLRTYLVIMVLLLVQHYLDSCSKPLGV